MKIDMKYAPELCASDDTTRQQLCQAYLDATDRNAAKMVTTDGHMMAVIPVESLDHEDVTGNIPLDALVEAKRASKAAKKDGVYLSANGAVKLDDGRTFPRGEMQFPSWRDVVPGMEGSFEQDEIKATVGINPRLLLDAIKASGCGKREGVTLEIRGPLSPVVVRCGEAYAVVMPMQV